MYLRVNKGLSEAADPDLLRSLNYCVVLKFLVPRLQLGTRVYNLYITGELNNSNDIVKVRIFPKSLIVSIPENYLESVFIS